MSKQPPANIIAAAQAAKKKWRVPTSIQLAQWITESGWGVHSPGNNPFGMKPRANKGDTFQILRTTEHLNGKDVYIEQPFRVFPSIDEAFIAHAELLATAPVYSSAMLALPNVDVFIDRMAPHYATAPNYADVLKGLIKSQGLDKYDQA